MNSAANSVRETEKKPEVKLLTDAPVHEDAFGAHEALAEAIASLIESERGGKAIALEGGWGSGKSTIVEMLQKKLSNQKQGSAKVFVFDAWSHEGDPLRRVFLEELTEFCAQYLSSSQREEWALRKRTEITGKSRESTQKSTPLLRSPWTLLGLAVLATFPISIALLNGLSRQPLQGWVLGGLWLALGIASVVPMSLLLLFLYCKVWPGKTSDIKRLEIAGSWISLYAKKIDETTNTTAHETQGPTSLEFQKYFSNLMAAFSEAAKSQLVLVLDNLDRVPAKTASTLWTTLRIFAECCEKKSNSKWADRIWFLVPYDPAAAKRLWDDGLASDEDQEKSKTNEGGPVPPTLSAAFLDKIFQIRFDVPPLLLSDWKDYLESQLKYALGEYAQSVHAIHRIFLLSRKLSQIKQRPPTPRHLKLFINDIGALARRFKDYFPVEHLALYAILRRQGIDVRHWLLHSVEEHTSYAEILGGTDFVSSLCAISYGLTDVDRARDLHLRGPIEAALSSGSDSSLQTLMKSPGFWPVLEIVCETAPSEFGNDEEMVSRAVQAISGSKILSVERPEAESVKKFTERLLKEAKWKLLNSKTATVVCAVLQLPVSLEVKREVIQKISADKQNIEEWKQGLGDIAKGLDAAALRSELNAVVLVDATQSAREVFKGVADGLEKQESDYLHLLGLTGDIESFVTSLCPIETAEWPEETFQITRGVLAAPGISLDLRSVCGAVLRRLLSDNELPKREIDRLVKILDLISLRHSYAYSDIGQLGKDGAVFRRIHTLRRASYKDSLAKLIVWALRYYDFDNVPSGPAGAPEGYQAALDICRSTDESDFVVNELHSSMKRETSAHVNALMIEFTRMDQFVCNVMQHVLTDRTLRDRISVVTFVDRFKEFELLCSKDGLPGLDVLVSELLQSEAFIKGLEEFELEKTADALPAIIFLVENFAASKSAKFSETVIAYLDSLKEEDWTSALASRNDNARLLIVANRRMHYYAAGAFIEAFENLMCRTVDGSQTLPEKEPVWDAVVDTMSISQQQTVARKIVEYADSPDRTLSSVLRLWPDKLSEAASEHRDDSFVRNIAIPILRSGSVEHISWLSGSVERGHLWWSGTPQSDRESMRQELERLAASDDATLAGAIALILRVLRFEKERTPTD